MMAKEVWPDTRFEGLDQSDGVDVAFRRGWVDQPHHGQLTDLAAGLRDRFDVVSMFHYLEHTADPAAELDAATVALQPGGHLVVEMPDPQDPIARYLGPYWVPWMAPQHLNMVSVDRLGEMLEARGYTIVLRQTGAARHGRRRHRRRPARAPTDRPAHVPRAVAARGHARRQGAPGGGAIAIRAGVRGRAARSTPPSRPASGGVRTATCTASSPASTGGSPSVAEVGVDRAEQRLAAA